MNPKILRRIDVVFLGFLFFGMVIYNFRSIQAVDLGWHLASGRYMVDHHQIPHADVFSFTCFGRPWVNTYWLQEVLLFLFYRISGPAGVIAFKSILVAVLAFGVAHGFLRCRSLPVQGLAAFWIFMGAAPRGYGWSEQASLLTLCFLAILLFILEKNQYRLSTINSLFIFLFFVVWANMHRGVLLGLLILTCCALPELLSEKSEGRRSLWRVILCFVATLATPWGLHFYRMISDDLHLSPLYIAGWASTPWNRLEVFWITWVLVLATWMVRILRHPLEAEEWPRVLISGVLAWIAFRYVSQVPYFMIWAVPFLLQEGSPWSASLFSWRGMPIVSRTALLAAILLLCTGNRPAVGFNTMIFPVEGCNFIESQTSNSHFFQDYSFGGYWMWRFGPARPVFIDGRYPAVQGYAQLYDAMQTAMHGPPEGWQTFLARYGTDGAMVHYPQSASLAFPFAAYFPRHAWALVYWDDLDLIFLRRVPANEACISKFEYRHAQPDASPAAIWEYWMHSPETEKSAWRAELLRNSRAHPASRRTRYLLQLIH